MIVVLQVYKKRQTILCPPPRSDLILRPLNPYDLQDKKGRLYIITALPSTTINLKSVAARLGAGKGGIQLAPAELITSILGVPLGSVTPLAVSQPTAANVVLLLDSKLKSEQTPFFVHPLTNTSSLALTSQDLEAFLGSLGREAVWVDWDAEPKIDKENPPDLKYIADAATPIVTDDATEDGSGSAAAAGAGGATKKDKKKSGGDVKAEAAAKAKADAAAAAAAAARAASDVYAITDSVVVKVAAALGVGLTNVDGDDLRKLKADVVMQLNGLKNAAYATGFKAAQSAVVASIKGDFS
jgi:hypothetical protein